MALVDAQTAEGAPRAVIDLLAHITGAIQQSCTGHERDRSARVVGLGDAGDAERAVQLPRAAMVRQKIQLIGVEHEMELLGLGARRAASARLVGYLDERVVLP